MKKSQTVTRWSLFSLPLLFLCLFYFYPLTKITLTSFFYTGELDFSKLSVLLKGSAYLNVIWFTCWQALLSTVLTLVIALPGAWVFTKFRFRTKNLLLSLLTVPFVLPTVVTAAALRAMLGKNGLVNELATNLFGLSQPLITIDQSLFFLLLAHVFYNYSLVVRIVSSYWAGLSQDTEEAAQMLGATPWQVFQRITLPQLLPAIGSASLLVFIFCFTSFGIVLILGGPGYATIEVEIYRQAIQLFNLPMAALLSLVQIIMNFLLMWLHSRLSTQAKSGFFDNPHTSSARSPKTLTEKSLLSVNLFVVIVLLATPLISLLGRSFLGEDGFTLGYYLALFQHDNDSIFYVEPARAIINSLGFAGATMILALILGLLASLFLSSKNDSNISFWDALIMLPLATSAVTLGFGYIISLNKPPLNLRDSLLLIPLAHALVAFPFVVRCILPTLRQIPENLKEAAWMLGASPLICWRRIVFPLIRRSILVGAVFSFSISMGEFGASAFVARPHTQTMPVAIFRFLSQPGSLNYGQALAMSGILMLVTCSAFLLINRYDSGSVRQI
ncbi:MAG: iron ABC transporter permease [Desulfobulbaceae bacterium]|nr:MAG: iron ABC transporter permease [Desulfobulbaceae bacterium]